MLIGKNVYLMGGSKSFATDPAGAWETTPVPERAERNCLKARSRELLAVRFSCHREELRQVFKKCFCSRSQEKL